MQCAGQAVHEEVRAGDFMPGSGKFPVEKLPERELKLLKTRSELEDPKPDTVEETPATPVARITEAAPTGTKGNGAREPSLQTLQYARENTPGSTRSSPPSPVPSMVSSKTIQSNASSKKSSAYDKYKDGSYWKMLDCTSVI